MKTSVFTRPHEYDESPFLKLSTLESVSENLRFRYPEELTGRGCQNHATVRSFKRVLREEKKSLVKTFCN